jgi:hypothetical protein
VDTAWDGLWDAEVSRGEEGWSVEIVLPWSSLRFAARGDAVALQVRRRIMRRQEVVEWARVPRRSGGEIVHYGRLAGLADIPEPWPLDIAPYELRGFLYRSRPDPDTLASGFEPRWDLGLDATLRLGGSLALTAAVNPDFGQIELDQVVLNLGTIETWYAEKRPFFLADAELFSTPLELFHTRRIGAVADPPELPVGWRLSHRPQDARIWEALKLAGEVAPGWTISAVSALTGEETVGSVGPRGERADRRAAPLTHFGVLRLRHDFGGDNALGLLATTVNRFEPEAWPDDLCPNGAVPRDGRCFADAYVGAVDGRFRTGDGEWSGAALALATGRVGGPSRTLPDGTSLDAGDVGWAAAANFARNGGNWRGAVDTAVFSEECWFNDLGYQARGNLWRLFGRFGWWTDEIGDPVQTLHVRAEVSEHVTLRGLDNGQQYGLAADLLLDGGNWFMLEAHYAPARWDDRELRDGAVLERGDMMVVEAGLSTDYRLPVTVDLWSEFRFWSDRWSVYVEGTIGTKPADFLTIDVSPTLDFAGGEPHRLGVDDLGDRRRYLLGTLESSSVGVTVRATWALTPRLSLQAYGQLFLAAASYGPFHERIAGASERPAIALDGLVPADPPVANPDFARTVLNASLVLRWEVLPGSVVHLVYSHLQASPDVSGDGRLDFGLLRDAGWTDMVLLKASWLWN